MSGAWEARSRVSARPLCPEQLWVLRTAPGSKVTFQMGSSSQDLPSPLARAVGEGTHNLVGTLTAGTLTASALSGGDFCPHSTSGNAWRHFWLSQLRVGEGGHGCYWHLVHGGQGH